MTSVSLLLCETRVMKGTYMDEHTSQKTPQKKSSMLLLFCIAMVGIAIIATTFFRVPLSTVIFYGAILACPLMHIFMMKGMTHGETHKHED